MAKQKGTFGIKVSNGSAAGFSNVPGASSYTLKMGKQFADKFEKAYKAKKGKNVNSAEENTSPAVAEKEATPKVSSGKLGGFKVDPGKPGGIAQVKTTSRKITLADIQDPNSKTKNPIEPKNIPESYKPQGDAPSSRQWSDADKAALESERPKGYVDPNFKPTPDTPTSGADRLKALNDEMSAAAKAKKMQKDAPISKSSPKPKKSTPPTVGSSQQFSGTNDTSHMPPVNLKKFNSGNELDEKTGPTNPNGNGSQGPKGPVF